MSRKLIILMMTLMGICYSYAQEVTLPADSLLRADNSVSLLTDSIPTDTVPANKGPLDAKVEYQAKDSIVMTAGNMAYLFGEGDVKYMNIQLQSENIEMNLDSSLVYATFGLDSVSTEFGYPLFIQGDQQYESKSMRYNFKTGKGYISSVITQQGEGFVTANRTKKMADNALNMIDGRYTTCDNHEHPHFYIQMTKAKVRPQKNIVTGPVYLVIEDVPLPIALPFAFFPFTSTYSSGIIMPTYGDESTRGFFLRDGGYYFALSDYMDLALTGEIYTKGSWGLAARSTYRKRYKFSGNFDASYQVTQYGDKIPDLAEGMTDDFYKSTAFQLRWSHSQDSKANPFRSFSASVNFATSGYDRNSTSGYVSGNATENTKGSSINFTQRFPNSPISLSASMSLNQRRSDSTLSVTLPNLTVTMSRIYPFKRKNVIGDERWYEKISMSYTGYLKNSITTKEDKFLQANLVKDWSNSIEHTIPVSATFSLFNYLNISPSVNYKERWYTTKVMQEYDDDLGRMAPSDTVYGFYRIYDYNAAVSLSTTLYGSFKPLPFLGDKVNMIRHRMEPSISFSATPDFGSSRYGYYEVYESDQLNDPVIYSPFQTRGQSVPGRGKSGSINMSLDNNVEMKIKSDADSTGFKKISLIDKLSLGMSYNLAADSFQWSNLSTGLRLKLTKSYTLNLNATFDTYTYQWDEQRNAARRVNVPRWKAGKGFGRLMTTGTNFSYTFNNDTFKKLFGGKEGNSSSTAALDGMSATDEFGNPLNELGHDHDHEDELGAMGPERQGSGRLRQTKEENQDYDSDGYYIATIPWSFSFSYGLRLNYDTQKFDPVKMEYKYKLDHTLSFNGNIQPTKNWRINFNATYDVPNKKISYMTCSITRTMHCFQMNASVVPVGPYKSYTFAIAVSSSLLKDLKYNKSSNFRDGQQWY